MARTKNATISVARFGERQITVGVLDHNLRVIKDDVRTRTGRGAYVKIATSGSFTMSAVVTSDVERDDLLIWLGQWVRQAGAGILGPARVRIPSIGFDRIGMIETEVPRGRRVGEYIWRIEMGFIGATDLLDLSTKNVTSLSGFVAAEMQSAIRKEPSVAYFYPGGTQLSGRDGGADEHLYGGPAPVYTSPRQADAAQGVGAFRPPAPGSSQSSGGRGRTLP